MNLIVNLRITKITPEFDEWEKRKDVYDDDGAYTYFYYFVNYLEELLDDQPDSEVFERVFAFINEVFEREKLTAYIRDLFNLQFFERFELNEVLKDMANEKLTGKARLAFLERKGRPEIGDGGTADAVRHTIKTGEKVGGSDHIQKAQDAINRIDNIINKQGNNLSSREFEVLEQIRRDLEDALKRNKR